ALVLRRFRIRPHDEDAPVGEAGEAGPDLLAGDVEDVAAQLRAGAARRQVGARVRLGESLAPDLLAREDLRQEALLLRLGAMVEERRTGESGTHADVDHRGRAEPRVLLREEELLQRCRAASAVLLRPVQSGPSAVEQRALPAPRERDLLGGILGL